MMCCELTEAENVERIFFNFFLLRTPQTCQAKAEEALSIGGSWLEDCVTYHPGDAIIFVGCGDYPVFFALRN